MSFIFQRKNDNLNDRIIFMMSFILKVASKIIPLTSTFNRINKSLFLVSNKPNQKRRGLKSIHFCWHSTVVKVFDNAGVITF